MGLCVSDEGLVVNSSVKKFPRGNFFYYTKIFSKNLQDNLKTPRPQGRNFLDFVFYKRMSLPWKGGF